MVSFFKTGSWEKDTKNGAAVTSLGTFVHSNDFNRVFSHKKCQNLLGFFPSFKTQHFLLWSRIGSRVKKSHYIQPSYLSIALEFSWFFFFILGTRRCPCLVQCSPQVSCQFSFHNYGGSNFSSCTVRRNKTTKSNNKIDCKLPYSNCCALALCA